MADPILIEPIGSVRRLPIVELPQETQPAARPGGASPEGLPERVERSHLADEPEDAATTAMMREKIQQFLADQGPMRMRFLVDPETRAVRIRIINTASGEIIREIPPGDLTQPPEPPEHL